MRKGGDSLVKWTCEPLAELGAHWALLSPICCSDGDNKLISAGLASNNYLFNARNTSDNYMERTYYMYNIYCHICNDYLRITHVYAMKFYISHEFYTRIFFLKIGYENCYAFTLLIYIICLYLFKIFKIIFWWSTSCVGKIIFKNKVSLSQNSWQSQETSLARGARFGVRGLVSNCNFHWIIENL